MVHASLAIANSLIELAKSHNTQIDPLKLQKLIYHAHGWHLAFFDKPLIDEEVQAWRYGPVITSVYYKFMKFGVKPIKQVAKDYSQDSMDLYVPRVDPANHEIHELLREIWRVYSKYSSKQLSTISHREGTPWDKVWSNNKDGLRSLAISNDKIKEYFIAQLKDKDTSSNK